MDLSVAYHHIRLHPSLVQYFQFTLLGKFYKCIAVPFGWCLAPYAYTKVMRPVVTAMRNPSLPHELGYKGRLGQLRFVVGKYYIQIYIDDILLLTVDLETHDLVTRALLDLL